MTARPTIGFLGLGNMGHGMAANILSKGFPVVTMAHRRREALVDLVSKGAVEAESVAAMARGAEVILLCVPDAAAVDDILRRGDGIVASTRPSTVVIDCTTSRPTILLTLAEDYPGLRFLDAPLGRSPKEAREGRISVMVGGVDSDLAWLRLVLAAFADTIFHAGPLGVGRGWLSGTRRAQPCRQARRHPLRHRLICPCRTIIPNAGTEVLHLARKIGPSPKSLTFRLAGPNITIAKESDHA